MKAILSRSFIWLLPLAIIIALIVAPIFRTGMFIDGLVYTNIAKNLSLGIGDFWHPLVNRGGEIFYEHPPLVFFLESVPFRLFGNELPIENLFNLSVLGLVILFFYKIWKRASEPAGLAAFAFPLLLFALSQENQLRYANNMLECSLTLFSLASVCLFLKVSSNAILSSAICGVGAVLTFLCKGPTGLFLLATPFLYYAIVKRRASVVALFVPTLSFAIVAGGIAIVSPSAIEFISRYLDQQVVAAIAGNRSENIANSRFDILTGLFKLNLPQIALCVLAYFLGRKSPYRRTAEASRIGIFLLAVGLSAILPIVISIKQASYYQLPSLPYLYLGLSILLLPKIRYYLEKLAESSRWTTATNAFSILGLGVSILYCGYISTTTDRRDQQNIQVANTVHQLLPDKAALNLKLIGKHQRLPDSYSHSVPMFLNRYYDQYIDESGNSNYSLYVHKDEPTPTLPNGETSLMSDGDYTLTHRAGM